ncbi:hypothetical protein DITRI_Ditri15bG0123600 [Diplodiscus trichospermus]
MGALASNRKRGGDEYSNSLCFQSYKKPRISNNTFARISGYPEAKLPFPREVHAPVRNLKFGLSPSTPGSVKSYMGNLSRKLSNARRQAFDALRFFKREKEVISVEDDEEKEKEVVSDDFSVEEVEIIEKGKNNVEEEERHALQPSSSSVDSELNNGSLRVEHALVTLSLNREVSTVRDLEAYKKLLESAQRRTSKLEDLDFQIELNEKRIAGLQALRPEKKPEEKQEVIPREPFTPLTEEEIAEVSHAFSAKNWKKILVSHESSRIDIRGEVLLCLKPATWLNDEVINLYLELLKERENREPKKFLKCHFFNTFFYKKLVSPESGYNYRAVKRWTSQRKLGYCLFDCDKIFVPIHKDIHWCLAVINKKDQKFQYLDSLKGRDPKVLNALAKYFVEEVRDKSGKEIDVSYWEREYVEDLPAQENGYDCGMFMLKYIDFYSRGLSLCFEQEHMPYFRLRTAKEILRLRAD